ncbi:N-acetylmuramoyl-L-alanine amidase [Bacillus thuringiensis]|uniref:N-acetylmuramoyl-L-alanine amidase n=1 Tax=Bacillus thuringiensis TaxID=1428 RepID=UPI000BFE428F|nr:N-acetylmuramoyl-L-alanine amidase [Bacillus thuringiensis]PGT90135.1 hypothetical protein COD17_10325 [Bacillus thuringiensis]
MKKELKKAVVLTLGLLALSPLTTLAEEQVNTPQMGNVQQQGIAVKQGDVNGVPFTQWIVPKGNGDIRPAKPMTPKYITIHETDNVKAGATARSHAQFLYKQAVGQTVRVASWHYTVDDKEIYQHIPINENALHSGSSTGNSQSIAIEIAVNQDGDYNKAVENAQKLVAYLMKETSIPATGIVKHQKWSGKNCPDRLIASGNWDSFVNGARGIADANQSNNNAVGTQKTVQISGRGVNIRSGAGTDNPIVRKAVNGEKLNVQEESNGWLKVGANAWIFNDSSYIK